MQDRYSVLGIMSGTSLDGVDLAYCTFEHKDGKWAYQLGISATVPYPAEWNEKLRRAFEMSGVALISLHAAYGHYLGGLANDFIVKHALVVDFIASHGHTVFHQPSNGFTFQLGCGQAMAAETGLPVVFDFRPMDVAFGGQGAPLVPIGDRCLFSEYDYCLNLGGFANVSYEYEQKRIAFDVCPVNIIINALCKELGKEFDDRGEEARKGQLQVGMLNELNALSFYHLPLHTPKSLGVEWVDQEFKPVLRSFKLSVQDSLRTIYEHIAIQLGKQLVKRNNFPRVLISGGGAYNSFLIERLQAYTSCTLQQAPSAIIEFKEALIFAFLGVLRWREQSNSLQSVTGAKKDSIGGVIAHAKK